MDHLANRAELTATMMCSLDLYTKTAEMGRVYGIQFEEVISRGSQFRVESILMRLAHIHGVVFVSPSPRQREQSVLSSSRIVKYQKGGAPSNLYADSKNRSS